MVMNHVGETLNAGETRIRYDDIVGQVDFGEYAKKWPQTHVQAMYIA